MLLKGSGGVLLSNGRNILTEFWYLDMIVHVQ